MNEESGILEPVAVTGCRRHQVRPLADDDVWSDLAGSSQHLFGSGQAGPVLRNREIVPHAAGDRKQPTEQHLFKTNDDLFVMPRAPAEAALSASRVEGRAMLAAAAAVARDLGPAKPLIYWLDLVATGTLAYAAFTLAQGLHFWPAIFGAAIVAVLAFYRGISFIHELTHVRRDELRGFAIAWNCIIGIPLLTPSLMYDDVHVRHHAKTTYGTARDPEYLPLASKGWGTVAMFIAVAALAPIGLLLRFGVLSPLSLASKRLRRVVVERFSALSINPAFRRPMPTGAFRREWLVQETATSLWAMTITALTAAGSIGIRSLMLSLAIGSGVAVINQVRTLAAHLWENASGDAMSVTAQYLDSVNVPPPAMLPALWAPVGLRYHALHHLLPSVPYHALGGAHRRLALELGTEGTLQRADHASLGGLIRKVARSR